MIGQVEVSDREIVDAVAAVEGEDYRLPAIAWERSFERFRPGSRTIRLESTAA